MTHRNAYLIIALMASISFGLSAISFFLVVSLLFSLIISFFEYGQKRKSEVSSTFGLTLLASVFASYHNRELLAFIFWIWSFYVFLTSEG